MTLSRLGAGLPTIAYTVGKYAACMGVGYALASFLGRCGVTAYLFKPNLDSNAGESNLTARSPTLITEPSTSEASKTNLLGSKELQSSKAMPESRKEEPLLIPQTPAQKILFESTSTKEMERINSLRNHPDLANIAEIVNGGKWDKLKEYSNNVDFPYILFAAHLQDAIPLEEDVGTAMLIYRGFKNAKNQFELMGIDQVRQILNSFSKKKVSDLAEISDLEGVKKQQQFFFCVKAEAFDAYTQGLMQGSFLDPEVEHNKPCGVFILNIHGKTRYILPSFGLAKAIYKKKEIDLVPVFHLSARDTMRDRIRERKSDVALLGAGEEVIIHGSVDKSFFAYIHDLFHSEVRSKIKSMGILGQLLDLSKKIDENNRHYTQLENSLEFKGSAHPRFSKIPTSKDKKSYLLNLSSGFILDGFFKINVTEQSPTDLLLNENDLFVPQVLLDKAEEFLKQYSGSKSPVDDVTYQATENALTRYFHQALDERAKKK